MRHRASTSRQHDRSADRRAAYGEAVPTTGEAAEAAENSAEADRRLDARPE